ncbi:MAG: hypothetical protein Crog4KO_26020 [Crocinitomicaceae bacterium]
MTTTTKYLLIGLGVTVVAGAGAYVLVNYLSDKDSTEGFPEGSQDAGATTTLPKSTSSSVPKQSNVPSSFVAAVFPLKNGSSGSLVRALQGALNKHFGASLKVDGVFGNNTLTALITAGFSNIVTEEKYRAILAGKKDSKQTVSKPKSDSPKPVTRSFDPLKLADTFHWAIREHKFDTIQRLLAKMKTINDYKSVRRYFKARSMYDGEKRTLLEGLYFKFRSDWGRKILSKHFFRMGLQFNGKKWSLSGVPHVLFNQIKTINAAKVWNSQKQMMHVPKSTVLGEFIAAQNGVTKFKTLDGKMLYTSTINVQYA